MISKSKGGVKVIIHTIHIFKSKLVKNMCRSHIGEKVSLIR